MRDFGNGLIGQPGRKDAVRLAAKAGVADVSVTLQIGPT
jgi:hypothetical protein